MEDFESALTEIRKIVESELPQGHTVQSVELTVDRFHEAQPPAFTVVVTLLEEPDAPEAYGVAYEITKQIREKWSRDDLYIKFLSKIGSSS